MAENNAVVGVYNSHTEADASIIDLQRSALDMKKLFVVGKDYHAEEHVVGHYNAGNRIKIPCPDCVR